VSCGCPMRLERTVELLERIAGIVAWLQVREARRDNEHREVMLILDLLAERTHITHLTVDEIARARRVKRPAVYAWLKKTGKQLEQIPGSRRSGVKIEEVFPESWMPLVRARAAARRQRIA
jgi:DNA-binding transcriptional ArsR family regulator